MFGRRPKREIGPLRTVSMRGRIVVNEARVLASWPIDELLPPSGSTYVYRFYSSPGRLLYVGMTENLGARGAAHRAHSPWFSEVASYTARVYTSRKDAAFAEAAAIRTESPAYNRTVKLRESLDETERRFREIAEAAEQRVLAVRANLEDLEPQYAQLKDTIHGLRQRLRDAESRAHAARRELREFIGSRSLAS